MAAVSSLHPLTHGQQALWVIHKEAPESAAYNMALPLQFVGEVNVAALRQAVQWLVEHYSILRVFFEEHDGVPYQRFAASMQISDYWQEISATQWSEEQATAHRRQVSQSPFDLGKAVFRATLFHDAPAGAVLLFTLHHIAGDAASLAILGKQVMKVYAAEVAGRSLTGSLLATAYSDYVQWEADLLAGPKGQRMAAYWQKQLAGEVPILQLPTDHARPAIRTFHGASCFMELSVELAKKLKALAREQKSTLFSVLLSAYQVLLHRYSGQSDIWVAVPTSTPRNQSSFADTVGYLVNPMIARAIFVEEESLPFSQLAQKTARQTLMGLYHQPYPFTWLIRQLQAHHDPAYPPLAQVSFQFERDDLIPRDFNSGSCSARRLDISQMEGQFDLSLTVVEQAGDTLKLVWNYNTDLFTETTVQRMAEHFHVLLQGIVQNPQADIRQLPLLTESEIQQLQVWNDTTTDYTKDQTIVDLFEQQVAKTPEAIALVFEEQSLSYQQLNAKANQLAHYLLSVHASSGSVLLPHNPLVAMAVERSLDMVIGLLAILKMGGAYVPIDPSYPVARIRYLLEDSAAPILLTQGHLQTVLPLDALGHESVVVCLDEVNLAEQSIENLRVKNQAEDLAYVIYTSGSTGKPKGVSIPHCAVIRLVNKTNYALFNSKQIFLQYAPISFDAATLEIWGALLNSAKLVIMPAYKSSLESLATILQQENISTLWLTSSLFNVMLDEYPASLCGVKQLLVGGEALSVSHIHKALQLLPKTQLINGYGPTENTTFTCCHTITDRQDNTSIPIGKPVANTRVFIVDKNGQPVPVGVVGELITSGVGLARGYLNRLDLTAEKFIDVELFGKTERIYKTGDLARWRPDGHLEYLGRLDHQVKLRGFRIELGEIEAALRQHPDVNEAVVSLFEQEDNKQLVAYLTEDKGQHSKASDTLITECREWLKVRLPDYMVPTSFLVLDQLPLTPNGKIDRKALPAPDALSGTVSEPPVGKIELQLAGIWQQVLPVSQVGREDNFFDLGGHSLLATQVVSRISQTFKIVIPLRDLFKYSTLAALAAQIETLLQAQSLLLDDEQAWDEEEEMEVL